MPFKNKNVKDLLHQSAASVRRGENSKGRPAEPKTPAARPKKTAALKDLQAQLRVTYRQAGDLSYRKLTRSTGLRISPSTISRIFNSTTPPKWENVSALLGALGVGRRDIETIWHRRWMRVKNEMNPLPEAEKAESAGELLPAGHHMMGMEICTKCSAWVADPKQHGQFHRQLERQESIILRLTMELNARVGAQRRRADTI